MHTGQDIVRKALDSLKASLTEDDAYAFKNTQHEDVVKEACNIEHELGKRGSLRHTRRVEGFLEMLHSYAGVLDTFCQGFSPMVWVWVIFPRN